MLHLANYRSNVILDDDRNIITLSYIVNKLNIKTYNVINLELKTSLIYLPRGNLLLFRRFPDI